VTRRVLTIAAVLAVVLWDRGKAPAQVDTEAIDGTAPLLVVHHVRDWHFVDRDLFGQDVGLEGKALDKAWADHLDAVEQVQAEQLPVLRSLVKLGVTVVYVEGLTAKGVEAWHAQARVVREQLADEEKAKETLAEAKELSATSQGERKRDAQKLAADAEALIRESRLLRIKAGAAALVEGITVRAFGKNERFGTGAAACCSGDRLQSPRRPP
jgi:hypothetical protein